MKLVNPHRFGTVTGLPKDLNAVQWFHTILSDITFGVGNNVSDMSDLSGHGWHADQSIEVRQPELISNVLDYDDSVYGGDRVLLWIPHMDYYLLNTFTYGGWAAPNNSILVKTEKTSGTDGIGSGQAYCVDPSNNAGQGYQYVGCGLSLGTNRIQLAEHGDSYMPIVLSYAITIPVGEFHHYMVVYNGGAPDLYVDGTYRKTGVLGNRNMKGPSRAIGNDISWGNFKGDIAEYYLFDYAMSAANILALYDDSKGRFGY